VPLTVTNNEAAVVCVSHVVVFLLLELDRNGRCLSRARHLLSAQTAPLEH
jgi:hypothetical protein